MTHYDTRGELKHPERPPHEAGRAEQHGNGQHCGPGGHDSGQGHEHQGMAQMAQEITRHYDEPAPGSTPASPEPFPPGVMQGLAAGAAQGGAVGAVIGYVLARNLLVIPGWELMYSSAPATIITLWLFLGAAIGVVSA